MLENGEKQQYVYLAKKQFCTCSTLFLYISLSLFCMTTRWNFQKLLSYTFYGGTVVRVLIHYFRCSSFSPCIWLVAASISYFVTSASKFWCCSSNKKMSPFFLSHDLDLCRPISRWASQACRLLRLYLCAPLAVFSKFVEKEKVGGRLAKLNEKKGDRDLERELINKGDIFLLEENVIKIW